MEPEVLASNIPGCKLCSYFTRSLSIGVGVMILSKYNVNYKKILIPSIQALLVEKIFECCLAELAFNGFKYIIGCLYSSR